MNLLLHPSLEGYPVSQKPTNVSVWFGLHIKRKHGTSIAEGLCWCIEKDRIPFIYLDLLEQDDSNDIIHFCCNQEVLARQWGQHVLHALVGAIFSWDENAFVKSYVDANNLLINQLMAQVLFWQGPVVVNEKKQFYYTIQRNQWLGIKESNTN